MNAMDYRGDLLFQEQVPSLRAMPRAKIVVSSAEGGGHFWKGCCYNL